MQGSDTSTLTIKQVRPACTKRVSHRTRTACEGHREPLLDDVPPVIHVDLALVTLVCDLQVLSQLSTDLGKDLSDKKALIKELVTKVLTEAS